MNTLSVDPKKYDLRRVWYTAHRDYQHVLLDINSLHSDIECVADTSRGHFTDPLDKAHFVKAIF